MLFVLLLVYKHKQTIYFAFSINFKEFLMSTCHSLGLCFTVTMKKIRVFLFFTC